MPRLYSSIKAFFSSFRKLLCNVNCHPSDDYSEWASLPRDVFFLILINLLLEPIDRVRVAAVCKEWRSLAREYNHSTQCGRRTVLPYMIMIPTSRVTKTRGLLYSVSEEKIFSNIPLQIPSPIDIGMRFCRSCGHGWLAQVERDHEHPKNFARITLRNPFRNPVPICLPPLAYAYPLYDSSVKVMLSADPTLKPDNYVVVVLLSYWNSSKLSFFKGGQNYWTCYSNASIETRDVIFHKGQVYTLESVRNGSPLECDLSIYDVESNCADLAQPRRAKIRTTFDFYLEYLVESTKGDLLVVGRSSETPSGRIYYSVYKLVFNDGEDNNVQPIRLTSIGDEALFVGCDTSLSVSASECRGCRPNSIYFILYGDYFLYSRFKGRNLHWRTFASSTP